MKLSRLSNYQSRFTLYATGFWLLTSVMTNLNAQSVITFDPPILPGGGYQVFTYTRQGVVFTNHIGMAITDTGLSGRPDNGTAHLDLYGSIHFRYSDGRFFQFNKFDVAEYSYLFASPQPVQILGHKWDNSVVEYNFATDGIFDSTGPLPDFQTVLLPGSFVNLSWVEFGLNTGHISIDNVTLTAVPEPSGITLVLLGAVVLALRPITSRKQIL